MFSTVKNTLLRNHIYLASKPLIVLKEAPSASIRMKLGRKDGRPDAGHGQITRVLSGGDLPRLPGCRTPGQCNPAILLNFISRYCKFLPGEQREVFLENLREKAS